MLACARIHRLDMRVDPTEDQAQPLVMDSSSGCREREYVDHAKHHSREQPTGKVEANAQNGQHGPVQDQRFARRDEQNRERKDA